ncbi:hypothetical protein CVT25_000870 [Psilocybe cyanescens]|uniref:Uncharacterized protein n=1 Tax=Psilocybe cyanescens TaxID=93625 RepID=A0A409XB77_PSICY|nr:hypothetical protein CVT25_000870 [Psilocybe cyanescens]
MNNNPTNLCVSGIYSMVYGGTMYIYLSKKPANLNRRIVLSAISVLYFLCFLEFIIDWYYINWTIVTNGNTRESIFWGTVGYGLEWIWVLNDFLQNSLLIISDGLLIWRCYHVWGQSFWAILVPLILFAAELGLNVVATVLDIKFCLITSDANTSLYNNTTSALTFVSLGTTVTATFIIGYRIHSVSQRRDPSSRRLFNHIATIIIESAAAYSIVLLLDAIIYGVPSLIVLGSPLSQAECYVGAILTVVSGMAPTILVARIATNDNNSVASATLTHISGDLEFGSQQGSGSGRSGTATGGDVNSFVQVDDAEPTPVIEVKKASHADGMFGDKQV